MIKRDKIEDVSYEMTRLHASERNSSWGILFDEFISKISDKDIRYYPNISNLVNITKKYYNHNELLLTLGSDRGIKLFIENNYKKYKKLILCDPSFPMYEIYGKMFDLEIIKIKYNYLSFPINEIINNTENDCIIIISNPSTPIGDIIYSDDIKRILNLGVPVLIDEAYIEFTDQNSSIDLINDYNNLYITRTLSKALGSAGIRMGIIFSNKLNISNLDQYRDMYPLSGLSIKWAEIILENPKYIDEYVNKVKENRNILYNILKDKNYEIIWSNANWLHIKGFKDLPENVIFKSNCSLPNMGDGWLRLQITDNLNDYICLLK